MRPLVWGHHRFIVVRAVHRHHRLAQAHSPAAQLQRHEVHADHQHAAIVALRHFEVVDAGDVEPALDAFIRPEPCHAGFQQAHAEGLEVAYHLTLALRFVHLGEAQLEVATGDGDAALEKTHRGASHPYAKAVKQR